MIQPNKKNNNEKEEEKKIPVLVVVLLSELSILLSFGRVVLLSISVVLLSFGRVVFGRRWRRRVTATNRAYLLILERLKMREENEIKENTTKWERLLCFYKDNEREPKKSSVTKQKKKKKWREEKKNWDN